MIGTFILRCGEGTGMKNLEKHKISREMFYYVVCKSSCIKLKKIQISIYLIGQPNFIFDGSCLWIVMLFSVLHWLLKMSPLSIHQLCHNWKVQLPNKKGFVSIWSLIFYSQISIRFIRKLESPWTASPVLEILENFIIFPWKCCFKPRNFPLHLGSKLKKQRQ